MSAFMCSNNHINVMLNHTLARAKASDGARWFRCGPRGPGKGMVSVDDTTPGTTFDELGRGLLMLNARSVHARYKCAKTWTDMLEQANSFAFVRLNANYMFNGENDVPGDHRVDSTWAMMQLCRCLEYQCCEDTGWKATWSGINLRDMHHYAMRDWLEQNDLFHDDDKIPGREWLWSI